MLDAFAIRRATVADAEAIMHIHFSAVHETAASWYPQDVLKHWSGGPNETRCQKVRDSIMSESICLLVAEDSSGILGFGSFVPKERYLQAVYVHPRAGRKGVGSAILSGLEQIARDHRVGHLELNASLNAEAFYSRHGYTSIGRGTHRLNSGLEMECIKMRKTINRGP